MDITASQGLIAHFSKLDDPRVDRNKKHELIDVIVLCVCAVVSGAVVSHIISWRICRFVPERSRHDFSHWLVFVGE